ncbi:MAG: hypothetical protein ACR2HH_13195 [Chthoniobacterales bacterium]
MSAHSSARDHLDRTKPAVDWADTAVASGYYDQARFIHEFRAFSGLTPASYLQKRGPFLNYLAVTD